MNFMRSISFSDFQSYPHPKTGPFYTKPFKPSHEIPADVPYFLLFTPGRKTVECVTIKGDLTPAMRPYQPIRVAQSHQLPDHNESYKRLEDAIEAEMRFRLLSRADVLDEFYATARAR